MLYFIDAYLSHHSQQQRREVKNTHKNTHTHKKNERNLGNKTHNTRTKTHANNFKHRLSEKNDVLVFFANS